MLVAGSRVNAYKYLLPLLNPMSTGETFGVVIAVMPLRFLHVEGHPRPVKNHISGVETLVFLLF